MHIITIGLFHYRFSLLAVSTWWISASVTDGFVLTINMALRKTQHIQQNTIELYCQYSYVVLTFHTNYRSVLRRNPKVLIVLFKIYIHLLKRLVNSMMLWSGIGTSMAETELVNHSFTNILTISINDAIWCINVW